MEREREREREKERDREREVHGRQEGCVEEEAGSMREGKEEKKKEVGR